MRKRLLIKNAMRVLADIGIPADLQLIIALPTLLIDWTAAGVRASLSSVNVKQEQPQNHHTNGKQSCSEPKA